MSSVDGVVMLRVQTRRVFKLRIVIGLAILKFGFWFMGSRAEAGE